jgi:hypothetical protein
VNAKEVKDFGSNIKNWPPEERKAAGIKFKEMSLLLDKTVTKSITHGSVKVDKKGEELWSHGRGQISEIIGYENCIVMQNHIIWGDNLRFVKT